MQSLPNINDIPVIVIQTADILLIMKEKSLLFSHFYQVSTRLMSVIGCADHGGSSCSGETFVFALILIRRVCFNKELTRLSSTTLVSLSLLNTSPGVREKR